MKAYKAVEKAPGYVVGMGPNSGIIMVNDWVFTKGKPAAIIKRKQEKKLMIKFRPNKKELKLLKKTQKQADAESGTADTKDKEEK